MKMARTTRRATRRNAYGEPTGFRKQRLAYLVIRYDLDDPNQLPVRTSFNNKSDVVRAAKAEHRRTGHPVEAFDPNTRKVLWTSGGTPNPRRPTYLSELVKRQKAYEKRYAKELKARTKYGVFLWRGDGRYQEEDAVRVFKLESAAEKYAKGLNATYTGEGGYVVRSLFHQHEESTQNPVTRTPNGPHIVGTTAYQVGVQEGERGTRKTKPTNVQIKDAIEAAYPLYKRTLQPSYVRKLASVYGRQWKAGVKDGKATKRANPRSAKGWKVEYYSYKVGGRHVRKATRVKAPSGQVVEFLDKMPKRMAIEQAKAQLERHPERYLKPNPDWSPAVGASTESDVAEVKRQLKLSKVPASVRVERNVKRSYGTLTVRPRGKPFWSMDQVVNVAGILDRMGYNVEEHPEAGLSAYRSGFHYMRKVRRNPESASMSDADRLYNEFHGRGPTQTTEVRTVVSSRDNLAELGQLCELDVHLMTDEKVKLKFPASGRNVVMLCSSPDGRQLYFEGGNQTVDLRQLGMSGRDWVRDNMALGVLMVVTYRTEKGFDKFELIDYFHKLGEVTGQKPVLTYDTINHLLSVSGGQYEVRPEGIVN